MIQFSEAASKRILKALEANADKALLLRIAVVGVTAKGFRYDFSLDKPEYVKESDVVVEADGFKAVVDANSAEKLQGATIDWVENDDGSADFHIDNPNNPKLDTSNPLVQRMQQLLEDEINPAVASHGGTVELVDVKENRVYLWLGGGCQGCGMATVTLRQGIETLIKENIPEITDVIDVTDHASGSNPYYAASGE